jgi:hypothetical protein
MSSKEKGRSGINSWNDKTGFLSRKNNFISPRMNASFFGLIDMVMINDEMFDTG